MTPDLQRGGHRQHGGPQKQVSHRQVDNEVVSGDPQVSVADHRQDDQNVADDGEQDEEGQHHAHRHRPAQVQRGGNVLGADAAVDGRVRGAVKIRSGAVAPVTHGETSPVTTGDRTRNWRNFARFCRRGVAFRCLAFQKPALLAPLMTCIALVPASVNASWARGARQVEVRVSSNVSGRSDSLWPGGISPCRVLEPFNGPSGKCGRVGSKSPEEGRELLVDFYLLLLLLLLSIPPPLSLLLEPVELWRTQEQQQKQQQNSSSTS